jgi:hypothetical protein
MQPELFNPNIIQLPLKNYDANIDTLVSVMAVLATCPIRQILGI